MSSFVSNFFRVTPQILLEYRTPQYDIIRGANMERPSKYYVYTGMDGSVYYAEDGSAYDFTSMSLYHKFPDQYRSRFTYVDGSGSVLPTIEKRKDALESESDISIGDFEPIEGDSRDDIQFNYDFINIYFLTGFNLDTLGGITMRVKTTATRRIIDDNRTWNDEYEVTLLDMFMNKDMLNASGDGRMCYKLLSQPLYMNSKFYDRYITIRVPSAYSIGLHDMKVNETEPVIKVGSLKEVNYKYKPILSYTDESGEEIGYRINPNDNITVEFATVADYNVNTESADQTDEIIIDRRRYAKYKFILDDIDECSINLQSNTDFFNVRMYQDPDDMCIVYYPVYGDSTSQMELNMDLMQQINSGAIPLTTNGFGDIDNSDEVTYYADANIEPQWKVYNDLVVGYIYQDGHNTYTYPEAYSRIIDYSASGTSAINFWRSKFYPDKNIIESLQAQKISLKYACRLVNELKGIEVIRIASIVVDASDYTAPRYSKSISSALNVNTYKIVNKIESPEQGVVVQNDVVKEKYIRSYYNATDLVAKNLGSGGNIYSQGQMTLRLNKTNNNYLIQLFKLNDDNVRIPFDLTGPYKYKMVFPVGDGSTTISLSPNPDSKAQNLGIGTLVFYITGEQAQQIMKVPAANRYFSVMTDNGSNSAQDTTLYEGKVDWLSA